MSEMQVMINTPINEFIRENYSKAEYNQENNSFDYITSFKEEYDAIKWGVVLAEATDRLHFVLKGDDVEDFIHRLSTNSVNGLEQYQAINTLFTNEKGRVIDRTTIIKLDNEYLLLGNRDTYEKIKIWLEKYLIMEDIKIEDAAENYFCIEVLGSRAESFLSVALETNNEEDNFDNNKIYQSVFNGIKIYLLKQSISEENSKFYLIGNSSDAKSVIENLMKQNHIFEPKLAGEKVRDLYRVENGLPSTPNEINDQFNPYEIDLIDEVDFEKGCYIGQEVIARLDTYQKVQRFLHKVKIKSDQELELPGDIFDSGDKKVGSLTSLVKRPESIEQIGLGIFRKKAMGDSNEFYIHTDQEKIKLKLVN